MRDVIFNEDRCRVRSEARALAVIRDLVPYLIRAQGMSVPEEREIYREDRAPLIALVTGTGLKVRVCILALPTFELTTAPIYLICAVY